MHCGGHKCTLPVKDTSGLSKLAPNATSWQRLRRQIRKLFILNPKHFLCKSLFRNKAAIREERKRHITSAYFYVIHPLSIFSTILEVLFFITWIYTIMCDPLHIWMPKVKSIQRYIVLPIRICLIITIFIVGYVDNKTKSIVLEPKKIMKRYLKTFFFFDIISCYILELIFSWLLDVIPMTYHVKMDVYEGIFMAPVIACWIRMHSLLGFLNNFLTHIRFPEIGRITLLYVLRTFIMVHVFTMALFITPYMIYEGEWPETTWLAHAGIKFSITSPFETYMQAFILATCYFFGISYKYEILMTDEQFILVLTSFTGRIYTLYLLADVLRVFGIAGVSESMYERNMYVLQQYMTEKDLPPPLQERMLKYYEFKFQRRYFMESDIIYTLSETLRTELFLYSARKLIQKVDILRRLPSATVGAIIASMKSETYSSKDVIIKIGWEIDDIYFISTGTVAVIDKNGCELCHLEDGDKFGINCLIAKEQTHTVVAVETTEIFIIGKNELMGFLEPYPELMSRFLRAAKQNMADLQNMEDTAARDTMDVLSELQRGNILEKRAKILQHAE